MRRWRSRVEVCERSACVDLKILSLANLKNRVVQGCKDCGRRCAVTETPKKTKTLVPFREANECQELGIVSIRFMDFLEAASKDILKRTL